MHSEPAGLRLRRIANQTRLRDRRKESCRLKLKFGCSSERAPTAECVPWCLSPPTSSAQLGFSRHLRTRAENGSGACLHCRLAAGQLSLLDPVMIDGEWAGGRIVVDRPADPLLIARREPDGLTQASRI